jgi:cell division protein FtsZ
MIPYSRDPQEVIPTSSVKIIGLGGAGANMLRKVASDGLDGVEILALNTDTRPLSAFEAGRRIQLGSNLTKGLGTGGDPELGQQAVLEAEEEIRAALRGQRIVFLCVGLGGGTGSGAAPIVTRIAREEGAFVVVFACMPFSFEGRRRMDQAETSLNQLAVLANALVTFDNNRMGELVVAQQGVHEAFAAADHMICESIKAVIRLVIRPGLINVGLDDLMSALRTNRSRCLFGSGIGKGKNRASLALKNALASPLLDQGTLLRDARTVLVHLCGGESLTLFEIESLMKGLQDFVPASAHVLFGASVDPTLGDSLSLTLISALPEDSLSAAPRCQSLASTAEPILAPATSFAAPVPPPAPEPPAPEPLPAVIPEETKEISPQPAAEPTQESTASQSPASPVIPAADSPGLFGGFDDFAAPSKPSVAEFTSAPPPNPAPTPEPAPTPVVPVVQEEPEDRFPTPIEKDPLFSEIDPEPQGFSPIPRKRPADVPPWSARGDKPAPSLQEVSPSPASAAPAPPATAEETAEESDAAKAKPSPKPVDSVPELSLDSAPRGRFEGADPSLIDGEDLDIPAFLRRR